MPNKRTLSVLLATSNAGKRRELVTAFGDLPVKLMMPHEAGGEVPVIEDGASYEENARKKAHGYYKALTERRVGVTAVLADDSGIEVAALDNAPGIYSARYAGVAGPGADQANNLKLLKELDAVGAATPAQRRATFRCVLVYWDGVVEHVAEGIWAGTIGAAARGDGGFGYDPLFQVPDGRHAAELTREEKFPLSHRGKAAAAMETWLRRQLS